MSFIAASLTASCFLIVPSAAPLDPLAEFNRKIALEDTRLEHEPVRGWLRAVLAELSIPESSQTLVFSKTSAQFRLIHPGNPRAIYFNDDIYVGWVRGGPILELSAADPGGGGVFYFMDQQASESPRLLRDRGQCLQCHESSRTQNIPGHLVRSVFPEADGQPLFAAGTTDVDETTPMPERWGGWYASGSGGGPHRGNRIFGGMKDVEAYEESPGEALANLDQPFDAGDYLSPYSDPVALLVLTHQVQMHNSIARAGIEARNALAYRDDMIRNFGEPSESMLASVKRRIERPAEDLAQRLLLVGEAPLDGPIEGVSGFADEFQARGPFDSRGRSLRQLDLESRLLEFPCSYLIYSEAFQQLPAETREYVFRRLDEVLSGSDRSEAFARLSAGERLAIREILIETGAAPWEHP